MSNESKPSQQSAAENEYMGELPLWSSLSYPTRRRIKRVGFYSLIGVVLAFVLFPLFWMVNTSIRPQAEMFTRPVTLIPRELTFAHYERVLFGSDFFTYYKNSIIVSIGVVLLSTLTSTLGGYGLARLDIAYKKFFARGILFGYMFPAILLSIPMFIFWRRLGIINSSIGLILAETAITLPFGLWLMWQFFQTVPLSLEEQARVSGASRFRAFWDISLPMAKPGMIAVAVFAYAVSWNEFTIPKILVPSSEQWVLTVGVFSFDQSDQVFWGAVMAASAMMIIPSFIFVYALQKYLLRGFRIGGVG